MIDFDLDVDSLLDRKVWRANRLCWGDILERSCSSFGDKLAFIAGKGAYGDESNQELTYNQANAKVNQVGNALQAAGLERGDRVIYLGINCVEAYLVSLGVNKAGMVHVPMIPHYAPDVMQHVLALTDAKFVFVEAQTYPTVIDSLHAVGLEANVVIPVGADLPADTQSFEAFINGHSTDEPEADIQPNDICKILFTSGTTSLPKGAMISHLNLYFGNLSKAMTATRGLDMEWQMVTLQPYPNFHIAGQSLTFLAAQQGGTTVVLRAPDPEDILKNITKHKVTFTISSPNIWYDMVDLCEENPGKYSMESMTVGLWAWATMLPDYAYRVKKLAPKIQMLAANGQTEDCALDQRFPMDLYPEKFASSSKEAKNFLGLAHPMRGSRLMSIGVDDKFVEPYEEGERSMRSPSLMHGYYMDQENTRSSYTPKGWFRSGDAGYRDDEGLMVFNDRIKDVIKTGGENVVSGRVEIILKNHPDVLAAAVVGIPSRNWGEAVTAFVTAQEPEKTLDLAQLRAFSKESLAKFEVPKRIIQVAELPETIGGKIQKFKLRKEYSELYNDES